MQLGRHFLDIVGGLALGPRPEIVIDFFLRHRRKIFGLAGAITRDHLLMLNVQEMTDLGLQQSIDLTILVDFGLRPRDRNNHGLAVAHYPSSVKLELHLEDGPVAPRLIES